MPKSKGNEKDQQEAMLLAERVKELRIANGLTQADVAEKLNVTVSSFADLLRPTYWLHT